MASRLAATITSELGMSIQEVTFWIDSQTVLQWIHSETRGYHAFVAHRVGEILSETSRVQWRHVPGLMNPADDCTRGVAPSDLTTDHRWLAGPTFLSEDNSTWPANITMPEPDQSDPEVIQEEAVCAITVNPKSVFEEFISRNSNLTKIKRVVAWMKRFIHNSQAKSKQYEKKKGELTAREVNEALSATIRLTQEKEFEEDFHNLRKHGAVSRSSRLIKLAPFIDADGNLRVGGRLERSSLLFGAKHPLVLPGSHPLSRAIIWHHHQDGHEKAVISKLSGC